MWDKHLARSAKGVGPIREGLVKTKAGEHSKPTFKVLRIGKIRCDSLPKRLSLISIAFYTNRVTLQLRPMVRLIFLTSSCNLDNGHHIISSFLKAPTGTKKSNLGRISCSGKNSHHHFQLGEAEISKMRFGTTNVFWSTPSNKKMWCQIQL
jgi:hypothetical protein